MKVGEYIIEETLGSGSFGETCKAKKGNDPICVLKRIKINQKSNKETKPDERRDIKLEHENIVKVFEVFNLEGNIYIAMELCESGNINDYFMKTKPDVSERFTLMVDMAKAVNYLHGKNVIHCGLKPENILIKNNGNRSVCKIGDFLVSRIKSSPEDLFTSCLNSPGYKPPEMQKGLELSSSTDVFTLGLIFFAVFRASILKDSTSKEGLIPGELNNEGNIEYLNARMREQPKEEAFFLESYFKKGESDFGKMLYSMLRPEPDERPNMEKVLLKTVEAETSYEYHIVMTKMKEEKDKLQKEIQTHCNQLEIVQGQLETTSDSKREVMADNETLQREAETIRNEAIAYQNEVENLQAQLNRPRTSFKYTLIFLIFGTLVAVIFLRFQINLGIATQNSKENQMNEYSIKMKQLEEDCNELKDKLKIEKNKVKIYVNREKQIEDENMELHEKLKRKDTELQTCMDQVQNCLGNRLLLLILLLLLLLLLRLRHFY